MSCQVLNSDAVENAHRHQRGGGGMEKREVGEIEHVKYSRSVFVGIHNLSQVFDSFINNNKIQKTHKQLKNRDFVFQKRKSKKGKVVQAPPIYSSILLLLLLKG